jgi:zinc protease
VDPPRIEQARAVIADAVPLPAVLLGMHIPEETDPLFPALQLLGEILGGGDSSRLHRSLVRERRSARRVFAHALETALPGLFLIRADAASPAVDGGRMEDDIMDVLSALRAEGVTEEERARACNRAEAAHWRSLEHVASRAAALNAAHALHADTRALTGQTAKWRAVTMEQLQEAAALLRPSNTTVLHCVPRGPGDA